MRLPIVAVALVVSAIGASAVGVRAEAKLPPLQDPVFLNIGFVCQWQESCMNKQKKAMRRAVDYTRKANPPTWKVHVCNRRAVQRRSGRVDWISYNNCIRNPNIQRTTAMRGGH